LGVIDYNNGFQAPTLGTAISLQQDVEPGISDLPEGLEDNKGMHLHPWKQICVSKLKSTADSHTLLLMLKFGCICSFFVIQQEPIHPASTTEFMILKAAQYDQNITHLLHQMEKSCSHCALYTSFVPCLLADGPMSASFTGYRRLGSLHLDKLKHGKTYISACIESLDGSMLIGQMGLPC
jgi:hypothetical protein